MSSSKQHWHSAGYGSARRQNCINFLGKAMWEVEDIGSENCTNSQGRLGASCIRYEIICHTHTWSHMKCHTTIIMVIQHSISSVTLVAHTCRSVTLSVCCLVDSRSLVIKSYWVCVHKVMHTQVHFLTHLVILLKICQPNHPPSARPLLTALRSISPQWPSTAT